MSRFAAIHNITGCGEVAFFSKEVPEFGEPFRADVSVLPDGKRPHKGRQVECPKCGEPVREKDLVFQFQDIELPTPKHVIFVPALNL